MLTESVSAWIKIMLCCYYKKKTSYIFGLKISFFFNAKVQEILMMMATLSPFFVQVFIFENNIYYRTTVESRAIRLVSTGKEGVVFNGLTDWLYEGKMT